MKAFMNAHPVATVFLALIVSGIVITIIHAATGYKTDPLAKE